jgi:hypothetical protein
MKLTEIIDNFIEKLFTDEEKVFIKDAARIISIIRII